VLQLGDARFETGDKRAKFGVLRCQLGVFGGDRGVLGNQPGALGQQLVGPVGACHTNIVIDLAPSVVDYRAFRALPP
jgi:hypothetical protein